MKTILISVLLFWTTISYADIYKCQQPDGSLTLTNQAEKASGCAKMVLPPPSAPAQSTVTVPINKSKGIGPKDDTKTIIEVSNTNYNKAAEDRKRIIQEEINLENARLLSVYEKYRIFPAVDKRTPEQVKAYQALEEKEKQHKVNIRALKKELEKR